MVFWNESMEARQYEDDGKEWNHLFSLDLKKMIFSRRKKPLFSDAFFRYPHLRVLKRETLFLYSHFYWNSTQNMSESHLKAKARSEITRSKVNCSETQFQPRLSEAAPVHVRALFLFSMSFLPNSPSQLSPFTTPPERSRSFDCASRERWEDALRARMGGEKEKKISTQVEHLSSKIPSFR